MRQLRSAIDPRTRIGTSKRWPPAGIHGTRVSKSVQQNRAARRDLRAQDPVSYLLGLRSDAALGGELPHTRNASIGDFDVRSRWLILYSGPRWEWPIEGNWREERPQGKTARATGGGSICGADFEDRVRRRRWTRALWRFRSPGLRVQRRASGTKGGVGAALAVGSGFAGGCRTGAIALFWNLDHSVRIRFSEDGEYIFRTQASAPDGTAHGSQPQEQIAPAAPDSRDASRA